MGFCVAITRKGLGARRCGCPRKPGARSSIREARFAFSAWPGDLVGQDDVGEYRPGLEHKFLFLGIPDGDTDDVGRHEIGGELDAPNSQEIDLARVCASVVFRCPARPRSGGARRKQGDQRHFDGFRLSPDHGFDTIGKPADQLEIRRGDPGATCCSHRSSTSSIIRPAAFPRQPRANRSSGTAPARFGKAITSRIDSSRPAAWRSGRPQRIPPCGGAPYCSASRRNPNFSYASDSEMFSAANTFLTVASWLRMLPPRSRNRYTQYHMPAPRSVRVFSSFGIESGIGEVKG